LPIDGVWRLPFLDRLPHCAAIVVGGREGVLGRQAVVDGDHQHPEGIGQLEADEVVGIQAADHPATAVYIEEAWPAVGGWRCGGQITAHAHAGQGEVRELQAFRFRWGECLAHVPVTLALAGQGRVRAGEGLGFCDEGGELRGYRVHTR